jgi:hypothetical protein
MLTPPTPGVKLLDEQGNQRSIVLFLSAVVMSLAGHVGGPLAYGGGYFNL